jgi:CRISPR/Cas system type I-B associated protein Csh2 (Cas7 group RAMP superfamily)
MLATLKMIQEKLGSAEEYMTEKCGLTKEDVEKIRTNLIVEKPAVQQKAQHSL